MRHFRPVLVAIASLAACGVERQENLKQPGGVDTAAQQILVRRTVPPDIAGCYAFFDHLGHAASESLYWAPTTGRISLGGRATKLTPVLDSGATAGMPGAYTWSIDSLADTVRILFHNGFSGTRFALGFHAGDSTLRGRATEYWDAGPPWETDGGRASAARLPCPRASKGAPAG